jgi:hypothetical protein
LTCDAVDCAAEASAWADCVTSLTASETEASFGTFLTAELKSSQALSRSPDDAFWTSWMSVSSIVGR